MGEGVDARSRLLQLTPDGQRLCKRAFKCWQLAQEGLSEQVGAQQISSLHSLIDAALLKINP
jgi:hypothetical protein